MNYANYEKILELSEELYTKIGDDVVAQPRWKDQTCESCDLMVGRVCRRAPVILPDQHHALQYGTVEIHFGWLPACSHWLPASTQEHPDGP